MASLNLNTLVLLSAFCAVFYVGETLTHRRRSSEESANTRCCYPTKYAWRAYNYEAYRVVNAAGTIEKTNRTAEVSMVRDGMRQYGSDNPADYGLLRISKQGKQTVVRYAGTKKCFYVYQLPGNGIVTCSNLPFVGVEEKDGEHYHAYRSESSENGVTKVVQLLAKMDENGACVPHLRSGSFNSAKWEYVYKAVFHQLEFSPEQEQLLEMPPASKICKG